ncbi:MAG TPA: hypothetical protein VFK89_04585, partial [Actinomycetota bacterium]|nr:hypothetical protein [Actinomycetota bacterium]
GDPIQALYSSSSGGYTENNENVWGGTALPYLRGVPDGPDAVSANPNHTWKVTMGWRSFKSVVQNHYSVGDLQHVDFPKPYGVSGRITVVRSGGGGGVRIVGSRDTARVSGWAFRDALDLKDTLFRIHYKTRAARGFTDALAAYGGAPGEPAAPAYHHFDATGEPTELVQSFERGTLTRDLAGGDTTWIWAHNDFVWDPHTDEMTIRGPILEDLDQSCAVPDSARRVTLSQPTFSWDPATGLEVLCS